MLHGTKTYLLQDADGQILETHSISAGLDYPGVGPEHAWLKTSERAEYVAVDDKQALEGFQSLTRAEGIIPALEPSHAIYHAMQRGPRTWPGQGHPRRPQRPRRQGHAHRGGGARGDALTEPAPGGHLRAPTRGGRKMSSWARRLHCRAASWSISGSSSLRPHSTTTSSPPTSAMCSRKRRPLRATPITPPGCGPWRCPPRGAAYPRGPGCVAAGAPFDARLAGAPVRRGWDCLRSDLHAAWSRRSACAGLTPVRMWVAGARGCRRVHLHRALGARDRRPGGRWLRPESTVPVELTRDDLTLSIGAVVTVVGAPFPKSSSSVAWSSAACCAGDFWPAAVLSGVLFSAVHLDPGSIVPFAGLGVLMAWVYWRRGSLVGRDPVPLPLQLRQLPLLLVAS